MKRIIRIAVIGLMIASAGACATKQAVTPAIPQDKDVKSMASIII